MGLREFAHEPDLKSPGVTLFTGPDTLASKGVVEVVVMALGVGGGGDDAACGGVQTQK